MDCPERADEVFYQNSGMRLFIPRELDGLLLTETPRKGENGPGRLFSVWERASLDAAKAEGPSEDSAGWLFSIGWVDEQQFRELLCKDVPGTDVFARDPKGNRMVFYHPTDYHFLRENSGAMRRDEAEWARLNDWARKSVRRGFLLDNLYSTTDSGLTAEAYDDSIITACLARVAYQPGTNYTVSTTQYGPLPPSGVKAAPFVEPLICNARYETVELSETPPGEYVVLALPGEGIRLDFFKLTGKENYVREVAADGRETLYKATFADSTIKASEVMQRWYWELAEGMGAIAEE